MNYMEQVAQMLGVELDEEFNVEEYGDDYTFKLTKDGLRWMGTKGWQSGYFSLEDILCDRIDIIKKPVLDEAETKYLSVVIEPFKHMIDSITKYQSQTREWILIEYNDEEAGQCGIFFPSFKPGKMYKGMKAGKHYTLEELGL